MSESIILPETTDKESRYDFLFPQLQNLLEGEPNREARCANFTAFLKEAFHFFWVGFYWVDTPEELVLGTFQGAWPVCGYDMAEEFVVQPGKIKTS